MCESPAQRQGGGMNEIPGVLYALAIIALVVMGLQPLVIEA